MQPLPFFAPLPIDDTKLRRQAAAAAERLLRRLDRLTQASEGFYGVDQRLFHDWFNLTFREELEVNASLERAYEKLRREVDDVMAYAEYAKCTLDEAYAFLVEENLRYELGTPEVKARIEDARRYRQRNSTEGKKQARAEAREKRRAKADEAAVKDWWEWFRNLTAEDLEVLEEYPEQTAEKLWIGIVLAQEDWQKEAALRFWAGTSAQVRKLAVKAARDIRGVDLEERVRGFENSGGAHDPAEGMESDDAEESAAPAAPGPAAARREEESLKQLYRKFVRYLHPDARGPEAKFDSWQKKIWHDGQEAYQSGNQPALRRLYRVVMLRLGKLNELTMSEIRSIEGGLEEEFKLLQHQTKGMRKAPFWKFSKRKDYFDIHRRYSESFAIGRERLEQAVDALAEEVRGWALITEGRKGSAARDRRGKSTPRRSERSGGRR